VWSASAVGAARGAGTGRVGHGAGVGLHRWARVGASDPPGARASGCGRERLRCRGSGRRLFGSGGSSVKSRREGGGEASWRRRPAGKARGGGC
jgi:hypothetical protein